MNNKPKHTPGPWFYDETYGLIMSNRGIEIAACHGGNGADAKANARLISAAPELLRELKSAIFYIESFGGDVTANFSSSGNLDAVKAVIKKAEGE